MKNYFCRSHIQMAVCFALARLSAAGLMAAEKAVPLDTYARLPIKEITVFKDGHAFVAHEGEMPTDDQGDVVMDYLPTPVVGTFWPYSTEQHAKLTSVVAGHKRVLVDHTALTLPELLRANVGAEAIIDEGGTNRYEATIVGVPERSADELEAASPPNSGEKLPERGNLILLRTAEGTKVVAIDRIQEVTFKGDHKAAGSSEELRDLLTLKLDWGKARPAKSARVGLFYLQKGVRWIPSYKVEIDGTGHASVKFEATIVNELADLDNVSVNLVIGVPTFAFKGTIDPIALQQNLAQLSQYFQTDNAAGSPFANNFSNAIMTQQAARASEYHGLPGAGGEGPLGPEIGDSGKSEDLFVFTVKHVTLKKGERMVLPVAEYALPYKDVFTLDLPFGPPPEMRSNINTEQQRELAQLMNAPKVMHKIRIDNKAQQPLTTAPALIIRSGRVLAQGMMTYTPAGACVDLAITTAVDVQVEKHDVQTARTPSALVIDNAHYTRIDLAGKITLTSHRDLPTEIEVTRSVLGTADKANHDGKLEQMDAFAAQDSLTTAGYPTWWNWYGWPDWWSKFNGIGRITWKVTLEPKQDTDLSCEWHYFWR